MTSLSTALISDQLLDHIADALVDQGYLILSDIFNPQILSALQERAKSITQAQWRDAGIGRGQDFQKNNSIRSDKIHWISTENAIEGIFLSYMNDLQEGLNRRLYMGLYDYESHFSIYKEGMFYKKHIDALKGKSNRVLSTVLYLNDQWQDNDAGELLLYSPDDDTLLETVIPQLGTMVIFLSEKFPHQVQAAKRERYSIAGWFRVSNNHSGHVDPAR